MRKSPIGYSLPVLILTALCLFALIFYQKAWLLAIQYMLLTSDKTGGLPTTTTPISSFSIPTAPAPVSLGNEAVLNNLGITVTRVISPADSYVGKAALPSVARDGKEYLVVDVKVRCISSEEKCHLTEFDFGLETKGGQDYAVELSGSYSDLKGLFEGGDIEPGKSMSGSLIFVIGKGESGLTLIYPRLFAFGGSAKLLLGKWVKAPDKPKGIIDLATQLLRQPGIPHAKAFYDRIVQYTEWPLPEEGTWQRIHENSVWNWRNGRLSLAER